MSTAYFSKQKYLPKWFRDFHIQKLFFKLMHKRQDESYSKKAQEGDDEILRYINSDAYKQFNWRECHCYVIDRFLWFMAKCGYTLQKDPKLTKDPRCYKILEELDKFQTEEITEFTQIIQSKKESD